MHEAPTSRDWSLIQGITNQSWPLRDRDGKWHARGIPERHGIKVTARIVWERDGAELICAIARRWTSSHVYVTFWDPRARMEGVWLRAEDVTRDG